MVTQQKRGVEDHVGSIVDQCLTSVETLGAKNDKVLNETLQGIVTLGEAHFDDVVRQLFDHAHPVKPEVVKIFDALGNSEELHVMVLEHLLHVVNDTPLVEGKQTPDIMVASCAHKCPQTRQNQNDNTEILRSSFRQLSSLVSVQHMVLMMAPAQGSRFSVSRHS
eukprot:TRINITY_DN2199_c0_g1_i1.p1 TRINITY_DN2199_c0_g1~~TRINITY_DN2199_c0_g1_i1.p1  ORF type:complete len:165 (+),score=24.20 TRINITY_DN2199_c0_g1_i1:93-587(+)